MSASEAKASPSQSPSPSLGPGTGVMTGVGVSGVPTRGVGVGNKVGIVDSDPTSPARNGVGVGDINLLDLNMNLNMFHMDNIDMLNMNMQNERSQLLEG